MALLRECQCTITLQESFGFTESTFRERTGGNDSHDTKVGTETRSTESEEKQQVGQIYDKYSLLLKQIEDPEYG